MPARTGLPRRALQSRGGVGTERVQGIGQSELHLDLMPAIVLATSCAGLTRASIFFVEEFFEEDGLPGQDPMQA